MLKSSLWSAFHPLTCLGGILRLSFSFPRRRSKLLSPTCPEQFPSTKQTCHNLKPYPFLFFLSCSLFDTFLLFLLSESFNFLASFCLGKSHSSSATWLLYWFGRRGSCLGSCTLELLYGRCCLIKLISFKRFRLWFWEIGWFGCGNCHLWFLSCKGIFELSLHGLEHFSRLHLTNFRLESILFTKMFRR